MRVLDLFSGIGGMSLGLERAGMETVAFCEIEPFCQEVLKKHWPDVPIYDDVRSLDYNGSVDLICGGYPCQPFSVAGNRKGEDDDRHLWPAMFSLIQKHRPRWVIGENVAGHITMGLDDVLADLERENYTAGTFVIPACAVNAKHRRDRVWVVAHSKCDGLPSSSENGSTGAPTSEQQKRPKRTLNTERASGVRKTRETLGNTDDERLQGRTVIAEIERGGAECNEQLAGCCECEEGTHWAVEPAVGRVAHGVPRRVDRLKALGNAVVPQIPEIIGRAIMKIETDIKEKTNVK